MRKTKIIFVIGNLDMGGAENSLLRLCRQLDSNQFDITVLSLFPRTGVLSGEFPDYVNLLYIDRRKSLSFDKGYSSFLNRVFEYTSDRLWGSHCVKNKILRRAFSMAASFEDKRYLEYIRKLLTPYHYDVSVGCLEKYPDVVATHCINADKRYIFYAHGSVQTWHGDDDAFERCDLLLAKSKGLKDEIVRKKGYDPSKIVVLHNVYEIDSIKTKAKEKVDYDKTKLNIVTVGRFHKDKGQITAIRAAKTLKEKGFDFRWTFVGANDSEYGRICMCTAEQLGLENEVAFVGMKSNPYPYIRFADIYVQPSKCEALPGTIVEALALEKPIVSTNTLGAQELINSGENGLLCGFEPSDIAEAIIIVNNPDVRDRIVLGAKESVGIFDNEINKYIDLFSMES